MRELVLVGLDVDGKHLICEGGSPADKFLVRVDDRLLCSGARRSLATGPDPQDKKEVKGMFATQRHPGPHPGRRVGTGTRGRVRG